MSNNKMLIDASHPEETRVAVVRGNRIEEFDFESQEKRQLRGNIYLAKVTRVEPSLQAAFVDYGGNRHGFLAFSEIHPDYYQIPVADRQALLDAEAAEARAHREAEDEEELTEEKTEKKKPSRPRKRTRKPKAADNAEAGEEESEEDEASGGKKAKPKKAAKTEKAKASKDDPESPDDPDNDDNGDETPKTMAAMVETDSISEELPGESGDDGSEDTGAESGNAEPAKPKRRTTRRKSARPGKKTAEETEASAETSTEETKAEDTESGETPDEEKPAKKPRKRTSRARKTKPAETEDAAEDTEADSPVDDAGEEAGSQDVESVGQEDALEEVPVPRRNRRQYKIQEVIKRRQVLLVQVVKEERGTKGAALTTYLSLAGRYSVLMPNTARGGGISRKITNAADRKRLKAIAGELTVPDGMGVILRTAGASRTKDEINRDFDYLMRLWEQVRNLTLSSSAPCLVYEEGSLIKRSIRDLYNKETGEILVSGDDGYAEAREFMGMLMPSHSKMVKHYKEPQAIFAKFGVETQLDKMISPQVTLKSGGYLVINQTEALVAVDVNSGRATREHSIEDTALHTNMEAAEEVARQLRMRDLAGLIVIDFIDMEEKRNNRAVEKKLKDCLKNDRARIQVGRISHFGLMEMSRQRIRASVLESTMDVCPHCNGAGHVRSDSAIALHVFRAIEEHVAKHNQFDAVVKTTPSIAIHLLNYKRAALMELEVRYGLRVLIEGDHEITGQEFTIGKGEPARGEKAPAPVGYRNGNDADTGEDESGGRKRSRRRRRGSRDDDTGDSSVDNGETDGDTQTGTDQAASENDDDKPRRKRRRGKRGGKQSADGDTTVESESGEPAESPDTVSVAETDNSEAKAEPEEKPKRRTSRRKKADAKTDDPSTKADAEPLTEKAETPSEAKEDEKPARRTTRRKTSRKSNETAQAEPVENKTDDAEKSGSKKSGWWSRGGSFF